MAFKHKKKVLNGSCSILFILHIVSKIEKKKKLKAEATEQAFARFRQQKYFAQGIRPTVSYFHTRNGQIRAVQHTLEHYATKAV